MQIMFTWKLYIIVVNTLMFGKTAPQLFSNNLALNEFRLTTVENFIKC